MCGAIVKMGTINIQIANVYTPPQYRGSEKLDILKLIAEKLRRHHSVDQKIIMVGDFNLPSMNWSSETDAFTRNDQVEVYQLYYQV